MAIKYTCTYFRAFLRESARGGGCRRLQRVSGCRRAFPRWKDETLLAFLALSLFYFRSASIPLSTTHVNSFSPFSLSFSYFPINYLSLFRCASCSHAQPPLGSIFRLLTGTELSPPFASSPAIVTFPLHRGCDLSSFSVRSERVICDIYLSWLDLETPFDVTRPDAVQLAIFT